MSGWSNLKAAQDKKLSTEEIPSIPSLRLVRTLSAPNEISTFGMFQSGTSSLTWSPDGKRLAAYIRNGTAIMIWSPDGKVQYEFSRYGYDGGIITSTVLQFLSGHKQLIAGQAAETSNLVDRKKIKDIAFSILDSQTGKVLRHIPGPHPGEEFNRNYAEQLVISSDERFAAVRYNNIDKINLNIDIFSVGDWQRIKTIEFQGDPHPSLVPVRDMAFSPDNKFLAVLQGSRGRIWIYETETWRLLRTFDTYPDPFHGPYQVVSPKALWFSPDSTLIAVGSNGGSWWVNSHGMPTARGVGTLKEEYPSEPLRIFQAINGLRVASLGGFPSGGKDGLIWPEPGNYILFIDGMHEIRFWYPFRPGKSVPVASMGKHSRYLVVSPDRSQIAVNFPNGVKIFEFTSHIK